MRWWLEESLHLSSHLRARRMREATAVPRMTATTTATSITVQPSPPTAPEREMAPPPPEPLFKV